MKGLNTEMCLERDLKENIGALLQIPPERLENERNLADFGFDSISLANLAARLTKHFEIEISPAMFFGHSSITKVKEYLLEKHGEEIREFYFEPEMASTVHEAPESPVARRMTAEKAYRKAAFPNRLPSLA
ncbi:acyl carrier protein [Paenibacillus sp. P26]|nr:acyl carrier protein [Paenibacillus sp. P26]